MARRPSKCRNLDKCAHSERADHVNEQGAEWKSGADEGLDGANRGNEFAIEATYQAQLTPWFEIQPDLQLIVQPGGSTSIPNALVLGLSATIDF